MSSKVLALLALMILPVLAGHSSGEPVTQLEKVAGLDHRWWLPDYLKEASGIAVIDHQSILLHDDELAVIYYVSLADRSIETFGWLGSPEFERDFEGIALDNEMLYLMTSKGFIYRMKVNLEERSQTFDFTVFDTGLESICELEGLHFIEGKLLLPCKESTESWYRGKLAIFEFDVTTQEIREHLVMPSEGFGIPEGLYPSAIDVFEGHYYIVSTNYLLKIDTESLSTTVYSLPRAFHFQPEGVGFLPDGSIITVEDVRKGRSNLTHYPGIEALAKIR